MPGFPLGVIRRFLRRQCQGNGKTNDRSQSAVVVGASALLVLGITLTLGVDNPASRPNLQTLGLIIMLIGLTVLVAVFTIRDPAD